MQQKDWLTYRGSLTEQMEAASGQPLSVKVIRQGISATSSIEKATLNLGVREWAWVREVELGFEDKCWVTARTVVPYSVFQSPIRRLALLKDKPLGPLLFNKLGAIRESMDVTALRYVAWQKRTYEQDLWSRRSIFMVYQRPLLVQEVFLPDNPIYDR